MLVPLERLILIVAGIALIAPFGAAQTDLASLGAKLIGAALLSFILWKTVFNNDTRLSPVSS